MKILIEKESIFSDNKDKSGIIVVNRIKCKII